MAICVNDSNDAGVVQTPFAKVVTPVSLTLIPDTPEEELHGVSHGIAARSARLPDATRLGKA